MSMAELSSLTSSVLKMSVSLGVILILKVSASFGQIISAYDDSEYEGTSEFHEKCFGLGLNITDDGEEQLNFFDEGIFSLLFTYTEYWYIFNLNQVYQPIGTLNARMKTIAQRIGPVSCLRMRVSVSPQPPSPPSLEMSGDHLQWV